MINTIILGHALNVLPKLPAESVSCVTCSPPYWSLRDYGIGPVVWDGDKDCKHIWGNKDITLKHKSGETNPGKESWFKDKGASNDKGNCFCQKCGAWKGSLGLEPEFGLYIKHLCDIFDEIKRVLRNDGTCWVNIGDTYNSHSAKSKNVGGFEGKQMRSNKAYSDSKIVLKKVGVPDKSLCDIPYRFSIEMTNRGWIKRNTIIWHKPNCMPSSADDRFTVDFEYLFFFTKNNKTLFWTNEKTLECVDKKPLGTKGIEGVDWEWRPCPACSDKDYFNIRTRDVMRKEKDCPQFKASNKEKENIKNKICPRCRGLKKIRFSFWTGHDYWFEQQFEEWTDKREGDIKRAIEGHKKYKGKYQDENKKGSFAFGESKIVGDPKQGRNKRCVWKIPTQPFPLAHFAVYPEGLIEIPIKAGCPEFVCKKCGKARVKILRSKFTAHDGKIKSKYDPKVKDGGAGRLALLRQAARERGEEYHQELEFLGYTDCGCGAGWESGITLDPFMGSGTTALVALKQRKRFIGIEIKQEYIDMSYKRIAKVQQRIF